MARFKKGQRVIMEIETDDLSEKVLWTVHSVRRGKLWLETGEDEPDGPFDDKTGAVKGKSYVRLVEA